MEGLRMRNAMGNKEFSSRPFEKLKKKIAAATPPPAPARQKKKEEYTDEELFGSAMQGVVEIAEFRSLSCASPVRKENGCTGRPNPDQEALAVLTEIADGQRPINLPDTQEYIEWVNPDYHDTVIGKLHEGRFAVQAFLDLHGYTVPAASDEMDDFLRAAFGKNQMCVKIIHGRGLRSVKGPRIKDLVVRRLIGRYRNQIIAFTTARQCDGGLGALYILLRKRNP